MVRNRQLEQAVLQSGKAERRATPTKPRTTRLWHFQREEGHKNERVIDGLIYYFLKLGNSETKIITFLLPHLWVVPSF